MLTLKTLRDVISLASDLRELRDLPQILMGLDPLDVYVSALYEALDGEGAILQARGIHFFYDKGVFPSLM